MNRGSLHELEPGTEIVLDGAWAKVLDPNAFAVVGVTHVVFADGRIALINTDADVVVEVLSESLADASSRRATRKRGKPRPDQNVICPGHRCRGFVEDVRTVTSQRVARQLALREFKRLSRSSRGLLEWMRGGKVGRAPVGLTPVRAQAYELRLRLLIDVVSGALEATPWGHFVGAVGAEEDGT